MFLQQNEKVLEETERTSAEAARCAKQGIYFKRLRKRHLKRIKIHRFLDHI